MPVKWTPETDQILLLKILETSEISVDAKAISASWPKSQEAPTARAVSERLVKIRTMAKENGSPVKFSVSGTKDSSTPTTPRKRPAKAAGPKKAGSGVVKKTTAKKRKRGVKAEASPSINSDNDDSGAGSIKEEHIDDDSGAGSIKEEHVDDDELTPIDESAAIGEI